MHWTVNTIEMHILMKHLTNFTLEQSTHKTSNKFQISLGIVEGPVIKRLRIPNFREFVDNLYSKPRVKPNKNRWKKWKNNFHKKRKPKIATIQEQEISVSLSPQKS